MRGVAHELEAREGPGGPEQEGVQAVTDPQRGRASGAQWRHPLR